MANPALLKPSDINPGFSKPGMLEGVARTVDTQTLCSFQPTDTAATAKVFLLLTWLTTALNLHHKHQLFLTTNQKDTAFDFALLHGYIILQQSLCFSLFNTLMKMSSIHWLDLKVDKASEAEKQMQKALNLYSFSWPAGDEIPG